MGAGKRGPSSSSPCTPIVCCMCGDLGLSQELFRCKICHVRLQHNNLYPKLERYSTCNWCLREKRGRSSAAQEPTMHRNASALHLKTINKPLKKQRTPRRLSPAANAASKLDLPSLGLRRQHRAFRSKVRKFKLLEEVCS